MIDRRTAAMDAVAFWRQFVVAFYFDAPDDEVKGTLLEYRADGPLKDPVPYLRIQTEDGRVYEVTAHQERLKAELVKKAPAIGDRIKIVYTGEADRAAPGMSKAKLFTVVVRPPAPAAAEPTEAAG